MQTFSTFLMFEGKAEEAITFYVSLFEPAKIVSIRRYGANAPGPEGTVEHALFTLGSQQFMASDSYVQHAFTFTPSTSIFVQCQSRAELDALFDKLSAGGKVFMPLDKYPFSERFGWVADRFGVSWQLDLAPRG